MSGCRGRNTLVFVAVVEKAHQGGYIHAYYSYFVVAGKAGNFETLSTRLASRQSCINLA